MSANGLTAGKKRKADDMDGALPDGSKKKKKTATGKTGKTGKGTRVKGMFVIYAHKRIYILQFLLGSYSTLYSVCQFASFADAYTQPTP